MLTAAQIAAASSAALDTAQLWLDPLIAAMQAFEITTAQRQAAFLAQIGHESGGLKYVRENLNYSAAGLLATFGKRFSADEAEKYARQPEAIANRAYANRNGNGDEASGDGWKYHGRGPIQLTGLNNYSAARDQLRTICGPEVPDFVADPSQVEAMNWGAMCAALYWHTNQCNAMADAGNFDAITKAINGAAMAGKEERRVLWEKAKAALGA